LCTWACTAGTKSELAGDWFLTRGTTVFVDLAKPESAEEDEEVVEPGSVFSGQPALRIRSDGRFDNSGLNPVAPVPGTGLDSLHELGERWQTGPDESSFISVGFAKYNSRVSEVVLEAHGEARKGFLRWRYSAHLRTDGELTLESEKLTEHYKMRSLAQFVRRPYYDDDTGNEGVRRNQGR
jgi:hypothetical protein